MSTSRKFAHDDTVKLIATDETGTIKSFHEEDGGFVYGVRLGANPAAEIRAREEELALVKIANDGETGFAVRYIS
jgi:hypothetical protein